LSGVCLAASVLSLLSPWFLLFLVPFALFGYIAMILAFTVYRFVPRGGDLQRRIHELIVAKAGLPPASRALDVGCGSVSLVVKLAKAAADSTVTGVDSWGGTFSSTCSGDRTFYPSIEDVREAIGRAGASIVEFGSLADSLARSFPLRHPKVLGTK
jgi:hypothetical protein